MALVRCKLKRAGGTHVHFGEGEDVRRYHFKPNDKDEHVAEITDEGDLARLLAIPEAYEPHGKTKAVKPVEPIVEATTEDSGEGKSEPGPYDTYNRDELAAMLEARTGKKPHHKAGADKLIAGLTELDAAEKSAG